MTTETGLVVLASDSTTRRYLHNERSLTGRQREWNLYLPLILSNE